MNIFNFRNSSFFQLDLRIQVQIIDPMFFDRRSSDFSNTQSSDFFKSLPGIGNPRIFFSLFLSINDPFVFQAVGPTYACPQTLSEVASFVIHWSSSWFLYAKFCWYAHKVPWGAVANVWNVPQYFFVLLHLFSVINNGRFFFSCKFMKTLSQLEICM